MNNFSLELEARGKLGVNVSFLLQDVLSVAFSADNRQIVSGSRDKTIKLWNTLAQCKYTIQEEGHTDWVSCVRFSPNNNNPVIVSCGWDNMVKVDILYSILHHSEMMILQIGTNEKQ